MAGFLIVQWARLNWPIPDVVIPLPGASHLARSFADWLGCSCAKVLKSFHGSWKCAADSLEENQVFLLLANKTSVEMLEGAAMALREAFPKKIYALSLLRETQEENIQRNTAEGPRL